MNFKYRYVDVDLEVNYKNIKSFRLCLDIINGIKLNCPLGSSKEIIYSFLKKHYFEIYTFIVDRNLQFSKVELPFYLEPGCRVSLGNKKYRVLNKPKHLNKNIEIGFSDIFVYSDLDNFRDVFIKWYEIEIDKIFKNKYSSIEYKIYLKKISLFKYTQNIKI